MKKVLLVLSIFGVFQANAQFDDEMPDLLTVGVGAGFSSFMGDLSLESNVSKFSNIRPGYYFNLERRFGEILGFQLEGLYGTLAYNERSKVIENNRNFESPLIQFGINTVFHFDNDVLIHKESPFSPYISAGFHYLKFDPYGDFKDKDNREYYYWSDGTIKDLPESDPMADSSDRILRDYTYETQLKDSTTDYKRSSFAIPLTFGLKWKFTSRVQGRIFMSYNLTLTDWIDNVSANDDNDKFLYGGFSIHYVIKKVDQEKKHRFDDVDFEALNTSDQDGDGILDTDDFCQHTPKGVEIDGKGCPLDGDGDGIANYLDKEADTRSGAVVDEEGRELTEALLAARLAERSKMIEERTQVFSEDPSIAALNRISQNIEENAGSNKVGTTKGMPADLKEADGNGNGLISSQEISDAINGFFDGSNNFTVGKLHELIDYFFEQ
ncbi:MAG: hypothetical protein ACI8Q1_000858 [Parvicella sp.]|jgi:hypothetical protein